MFLQLILHCLLGYRELHDGRYYRDDPLVKPVLGLQRLPDVSTLSRMLKEADANSVKDVRSLLRELIIERVQELQMQTTPPSRNTTAKRASLWICESVDTLRKTLIQRARKLSYPGGVLTLTISANTWIKNRLLAILGSVQTAQ